MTGIDKIVRSIQAVIDNIKIPSKQVPPILLYCTAIKRTGGSPMKTTAEIIDMLEKIGFNLGKNEDGSENMVGQAIYCAMRGVYDMVSKDMVGQGATLTNSIAITGTTADGIPIVGTNENTTTTLVIMQ